ncbi:MAG TPA: hypothetical protein VNJ08_11520 [Bacteriovoracaceae bacterium]|nr:hypothetical protein [Bacteriovoracaceae bacterium]
MKSKSPFDDEALHLQLLVQKKHGWDLENDIPWDLGIKTDAFLAPLDEDALVFPGASAEQRIVISQLLGLMVNQTISEMESSMPKLKLLAWENKLKAYPVNPEMFELGELFYEEERKHALSFIRYQELFCKTNNIEPHELNQLLPCALNSNFMKAITWNAEQGGASFWWLVAAVEEVSVQIFKSVNKCRKEVDPLYYHLHQKHAEEEIRHENYAFLMLEVDHAQRKNLKQNLINKTDLLLAESAATPWVLTELTKIYRARDLKHKSPFFEILASCIPLMENMDKRRLIKNLYKDSPYVSWLVNPNMKTKHHEMQKKTGALSWVSA